MPGPLDRIPSVIDGRYRVLEELGRGGMGVVFLARDVKHERDVAVKVLRPELASAVEAHRFHREIRIAASLNHPHILPIYDSGEVEGLLYYVMPHTPGETLRQRLDHGPLPIPHVLTLARNVTAALDHAHARNVIHRDIKPANIFLSDDEALVGDFGVAVVLDDALRENRLTRTGVSVGSPRYMSPEQLTDPDGMDRRSDVFSLGVVLFECVTGHLPFAGEEGTGHPLAWMAREPGELGEACPPPLARFIRRCLAVDPAERLPADRRVGDAWREVEDEIVRAGSAGGGGISRRAVAAGAALLVVVTAVVAAFLAEGPSPAERTVLLHQPVVTWESREEEGRFVPNGAEISFLSDRDGDRNVWVVSTDGEGERQVTRLKGGVDSHLWSPDGARLGVVVPTRTGHSLAFLDVEGASVGREVPLPGRRPPSLVRWRADGIHLIVDGELWSMDPVGLRLHQRVDPGTLPRLIDADVHPEDDRFVFAAARDDGGADLWLAGLDGTGLVRLTDHGGLDRSPCWLSGEEIAFVSDRGGRMDVWRIPMSDRAPRPVTTGSSGTSGIACAPGDAAVVVDRQDERADLWLWDPQAGEVDPLTLDRRIDLLPSASRQGRVAFQRERTGEDVRDPLFDANVMIGTLQDSELRDVRVLVENAFHPRISPDGDRVAFRRRSSPFMALGVAAVSGEEWILTDRFPLTAYRAFPPVGWERENAVWSGGGDVLYYVERPGSPDGPSGNRWALSSARMTPSGPIVDTLVSFEPGTQAMGLSVSPGGTHLAYVSVGARDELELRTVQTDGSGERTLLREATAEDLFNLGWLGAEGPVVVLRSFQGASGLAEVQPLLLELDGRVRERARLTGAVVGHAWLDRLSASILAPYEHDHALALGRLDLNGPADVPWNPVLESMPFSGIEVLPDGRILFSRHDVNPDLWKVVFASPG